VLFAAVLHVLQQLVGILVREVLVRVPHPHFLQIPRYTILTEPRRTEATEDVETAFLSAHLFQNRVKTLGCDKGINLDELLVESGVRV